MRSRVKIPEPVAPPIGLLGKQRESFSHPGLIDVEKYLQEHSQAEDIVNAYNDYILRGLQRQLSAYKVPYGANEEFYMTFALAGFDRPIYIDINNEPTPLYPAQAKNLGLSYLATVFGHRVGYRKDTHKLHEKGSKIEMFQIPVMIGSVLCYTSSVKDRRELELMGENPDDPGGYFIYNGNIRTIPGTEKLRIDRLFIFSATAKVPFDRVSQTIVVPTGTAVSLVFERNVGNSQYIKACHFNVSKMKKDKSDDAKKSKCKNSLNVLTLIDIICFLYHRKDLLRSSETGNHYGVTMIQSLICTKDPRLREKQRRDVFLALQGTIMEYNSGATTNQKIGELLGWLEHDSKQKTLRQKYNALLSFVTEQIFWSVPITKTQNEDNITYHVEGKIRSICYLTCRFLLYKTGYEPLSDKDNWANKKVDTAIVGMSQYFWSEYQKLLSKKLTRTASDEVKTIETAVEFAENMSSGLTGAFLAPFNKKIEEGTTGSAFEPSQTVNPTNLVHLLSEVTKIQVSVDKKVKSQGVRSIQDSQFGYICPAQTPDGIKCGMVKRKSLLAHISIYVDPSPIIDFCIQRKFISTKEKLDKPNLLVVNEKIIGWCNGEDLKVLLLKMKQRTPAAYSIITKRKRVDITSKWYKFDVRAAVELIFAQLEAEIKEGTEEDRADGYEYSLYIDGEFFSAISKKIKTHLELQSSLPHINSDTSLLLDNYGALCVYTSAGRLIRVGYTVRNNKEYNRTVRNKSRELPDFELLVDTEEYGVDSLPFNEMENRGFVQYIDAYEEADPNFYYAFDKDDFKKKLLDDEEEKEAYLEARTHVRELRKNLKNLEGEEYDTALEQVEVFQADLESREEMIRQISQVPISAVGLHGIGIYGVAAAYAPLSQHDPAGKTVHTSKTILQTLGLETSRYAHRKQESLMASNIPLAPPSITAQFGDRRSFLGRDTPLGFIDKRDNQEDAILLSSNLLELGFVHYKRQFTIETEVTITSQLSQYIGISSAIPPERLQDYKHLTRYGLPPIRYRLKEGQIAIARYEIDSERKVEQLFPVIVGKGEAGRVIDILIHTTLPKGREFKNKIRVSILVEAVYKPEKGDKFSYEHGQKSVVGGQIIPQYDMPFDSMTGTSPLVLLNTHAIKNRQTMGLLLEQMVGIKAALFGKAYDTSAFVPHTLDAYIKELNEKGLTFSKTRFVDAKRAVFYNGYRFTGYARMQQLHHFAHRKISVMGYADTEAITTQRMKSAKVGGEKMGEMEKNVIIAYGMWGYFMEKFRIHSDNYVTYACKSCEFFTHVGGNKCPHCGDVDTLLLVEVPGSLEYLKRIARAQGIKISSSIGTQEEFAEYIIETIKWLDNIPIEQNYIAVDDDEEELFGPDEEMV